MHSWSVWLVGLVGAGLSGCLTSMPQKNLSDGAAPVAEQAQVQPFVWPHGARAAISLTYDDAIQSQLDNAVPALTRHGLPATFFLSGTSSVLQASPDRYRALAKAGNELGAHTMNHPCDRALSFVKPGFGLQDYDSARMTGELTENIQQLRDLGQPEPFTFAYPCGSTWFGDPRQSVLPLVQKLFVAARGVNAQVVDPSHVSLFEVPSVSGNESAAGLTGWVDRALASGGWVVFLFHGVAGDYLSVEAGAHEALLAYLEQHKSSIWTERFGTVAQYIKAQSPG